MIEDLIKKLNDKNVILFVGSGVSRNLGLPSWSELIGKMAKELGYDEDIFNLLGDNLTLAEYYKIQKKSIKQLALWMDEKWHDPSIKIEESRIHKLIADLNFPIIYTTNYDRWLEKTFDYYEKEYVKVANVGDFVKLKQGVPQIIKFHGDFDDASSIVFTESSYFDRLEFESPLDIKFRSDILGKTILFIGYSLSDINTRYIFYKLNKLWEHSSFHEKRPESYIFLARPNKVEEEILRRRKILPIVSSIDDPGKGLEKFLGELANKDFDTKNDCSRREKDK